MGGPESSTDESPSGKEKREWQNTESDFWDAFYKKHATEHAQAEVEWQKEQADIRVEIATLNGRKHLLSQMKHKLATELLAVEQEFADVVNAYSEKAEHLHALECEHQKKQKQRLQHQRHLEHGMAHWFRDERRSADDMENNQLPPISSTIPLALRQPQTGGEQQPTRRPLPSALPGQPLPSLQHESHIRGSMAPIVDIVDSDSNVIGVLRRFDPWNQWIDAMLRFPIKRPVMIRHGRKFNAEHLESIYDRCEPKGVKWLACMIQATGTIQMRRCASCERNQGAFAECIVLGGPQFPKCGNCEWNRQGCHPGSGGSNAEIPIREHATDPGVEGVSNRYGDTTSPARMAVAAHDYLGRVSGGVNVRPAPDVQTSNSGFKSVNGSGSTCANSPDLQRRNSGYTSTNMDSDAILSMIPIYHSIRTTNKVSLDRDSLEILPLNLVLRHNGRIYTSPPCMEGVPVEKITPEHPYWDPKWFDPVTRIEPRLKEWQGKLEDVLELEEQGKDTGSSKYQYGRQVTRGHLCMKFLQSGEISPYQLLNKRYITGTRGSIASYDTMYRLCETLDELRKYRVQVAPLDWVRQRLHELIEEQGSSFNLAKTMHDFYNDKKLTAARNKAGFKNIGRPAGIKMPPRVSTGSERPGSRKRKSPEPGSASTSTSQSTPTAGQPGMHVDSPASQSRGKRQKSISRPPEDSEDSDREMEDELRAEDYSDADSWSGAEVSETDFRVYQMRSRLFTSSDKVTQYLAWVEDKQMFEHQVLKETDPVEWGVHRAPIDFHFDLDDLFQVIWNKASLRIYLALSDEHVAEKDDKPRGPMMIAFKRERTKRRFLAFCANKDIDLVSKSA